MLECSPMAERDSNLLSRTLGGSELFSGLDQPALLELARRLRRHDHPAQTLLFLEGQPASIYYLIAQGKVKITQTSPEGEEVILHVAEPGQVIGALPTLGEGGYPASAETLEDCVTFSVEAEDFESILLSHPQVMRRLLTFATRQLQISHRRLRELATERVERRIARTLTRLASQLGRKQGTSIEIDAPLSRQDLAEMSGTTLYTVSRTLKRWQSDGLVRSGRQKIVILNPHGLVTIAEDLPDNAKTE
jgi:CRP/FNR family transcriptional regulator, nitrogen oxide reductase regulator